MVKNKMMAKAMKKMSEKDEIVKGMVKSHKKEKHEKKESKKHEKKEHKANKMKKVMKEFSAHELHSGSKKGPVVTNPKQAVAIAYSEAKKSKKKK